MKVLITGGGGFIGSHLVERFVTAGHEVRVLDTFATGRRENLLEWQDDFELVEGDIQSYERVHNAVSGCDVVLHQETSTTSPADSASRSTTCWHNCARSWTATPRSYSAERPGDVGHSLADISRAQADLGYEPRVDLREGLTRTVEYYDSRVAA